MFKKYTFGLLVLALAGLIATLALVTSFSSATPQIDDEPVVLDIKTTPAENSSPSVSATPTDNDQADDAGQQEAPAAEEEPQPAEVVAPAPAEEVALAPAEEVAPAPAAVVPEPAYIEQPLPPAPAPQYSPGSDGDDDWDDDDLGEDDWDDDDD